MWWIMGLLALLLFAPTAAVQARAVVDSIDGFVRSELARQGVPGLSVAAVVGAAPRLVGWRRERSQGV
jgi:hypothetical protein